VMSTDAGYYEKVAFGSGSMEGVYGSEDLTPADEKTLSQEV
jgi:hypothetical protein